MTLNTERLYSVELLQYDPQADALTTLVILVTAMAIGLVLSHYGKK